MISARPPLFNPAPTKKARATKTKSRTNALTMYKPVRVNNGHQAFPKQKRCTLRYCDSPVIISTTGAYTEYLYSANGMYDPNITGSGHQPRYFDQSMAIYNHYTVLSSRIAVSMLAPLDGTLIWTLFRDDDTTTGVTSGIYAIERQSCVYKAYETTNTPTGNVLRNSWKASSTFTGDPLSKDELAGDSSANPVESTYFVISVQNGNLTTSSYPMVVTIDYDVVFSELKSIGSS